MYVFHVIVNLRKIAHFSRFFGLCSQTLPYILVKILVRVGGIIAHKSCGGDLFGKTFFVVHVGGCLHEIVHVLTFPPCGLFGFDFTGWP